MPSETTSIGINIGTRYVGIAVMVGTELRDWRIRVVQGIELVDKFQWLTGMLARLFEIYPPTSVAIKGRSASRTSPALEGLVLEAKEYLQDQGVTVREFTLGRVKAILFSGQRANKIQLAEYIVSKYPVLSQEWQREQSLRRPYRMMMFEAVALADVQLGQRGSV